MPRNNPWSVVMKNLKPFVMLTIIAVSSTGVAHDRNEGPAVVPDAERKAVAAKNAQGPTKNKGIRSVTPLGAIGLGEDFPALHDRQLRARVLVIEPGGVVAVHEHQQRPGVAYILEGSIVEHREGSPKPLLRGKGAVSFEKSGVIHWWENRSNSVVRALVVDIVPEEKK